MTPSLSWCRMRFVGVLLALSSSACSFVVNFDESRLDGSTEVPFATPTDLPTLDTGVIDRGFVDVGAESTPDQGVDVQDAGRIDTPAVLDVHDTRPFDVSDTPDVSKALDTSDDTTHDVATMTAGDSSDATHPPGDVKAAD